MRPIRRFNNKRRSPKSVLVSVLVLFALSLLWQFDKVPFLSSSRGAPIFEEKLPLPPVFKETVLEYFSTPDCQLDSLITSQSITSSMLSKDFEYIQANTRGLRLTSDYGYAEFVSAHSHFFYFSIFPFDECVTMYESDSQKPGVVKLFSRTPLLQTPQISPAVLKAVRTELLGYEPTSAAAEFRVVFSCESKEYFGYQTWANRLAFAQSQTGYDATWTRLLTCHEPDDLASWNNYHFPTFTAHRHPYSHRYGPINKPDIITKWFESKDAPLERVILVIDPDSWLLKPVYEEYISRVQQGFALGQEAYYTGSRTAQLLWKELCEFNCESSLDLVGVPYVIHREDLRILAPLWRYYVLKIKHRLEFSTPGHEEFAAKYGKLDVNWASEMFGYNLAAAHLGIKHEIVKDLQVRDVDGSRTFEQCKNKASLHMGRAWFPRNHPAAKQWIHTEGKPFRNFGDQVWCKCNYTASTIKPWPIPEEGVDFVSYHTLRLLHESDEAFGLIPDNPQWRRKKDLRHDYGWAHP